MKKILIIDEQQESMIYLSDAAQFAFREAKTILFSSLIGIKKILNHGQYSLILIGVNKVNDKKLERISEIKQLQPDAMVVAISKFEQQEQIFNSLRQGVDGYILKSESYANLIKILRDTESGIPPMSPAVTRNVILSFRNPISTPALMHITKRENDVLRQLSKGMSNKAIANELSISAYTVADHVKSLFTKLNVKTRAAAIAYALNNQNNRKASVSGHIN